MPPALVLWHIQRLPDTSLTHALQHGDGDWKHFGWGQDRHLLADLYDAITFNTEATGNWSKPPKLPSWPRPKTKKKTEPDADKPKKPLTVRELWSRMKASQ